jgi:hypothetical protein
MPPRSMLGKSFREGTIVNLVHNGFLGSQGFAERQLSEQIVVTTRSAGLKYLPRWLDVLPFLAPTSQMI